MGPGLRPYVYRDFPMMMHKAGRPENGMGKDVIVEQEIAETETRATQLEHQGFRPTPLEALQALESEKLEYAKLAAELNYDQQHKLSARASAEVEQARSEHGGDISKHLPSVPVTPIKPRKEN